MGLAAAAGIMYAFGQGMSIIGGNQRKRAEQRAAKARAKYEKAMAEWSWDETKRREAFSQYEVEIARINEESVRNFTDQMNWDEYNRKLYIRDYDYRSQVEAYNQSELEYAQQIDYNAMGARLATEEQHVWLEEQLNQAQFESDELTMTTQKQYNDLALDSARARDAFDLTRENINLQHRAKAAEFAGKSMEGMLKTLEAKGKSKVRGQPGRSSRKAVQAIGAIADFQQSMLNDMATKSEQAFANQQQQNFVQYQQSRAKSRIEQAFVGEMYEQGKRKIQFSADSAMKAHASNMLRIEYDQYGADMAAESRRLAPPPSYDELPPITAPYFMPQTHIVDAYKTKKKPPGPPGAANLMAGSGLMMAGQFMQAAAGAANLYTQMGGTFGSSSSGGSQNYSPSGSPGFGATNPDWGSMPGYFGNPP